MSDEKTVQLSGDSYDYTSCDCGTLITEEQEQRYGRCYTCWEAETFTIEERLRHTAIAYGW